MPIYQFRCRECKEILEKVQPIDGEIPECCGEPMKRIPTFPVMVKIMGQGGYPSRRKFLKGSAPNTTRATKPWLSYDPADKKANPMGQKIEAES